MTPRNAHRLPKSLAALVFSSAAIACAGPGAGGGTTGGGTGTGTGATTIATTGGVPAECVDAQDPLAGSQLWGYPLEYPSAGGSQSFDGTVCSGQGDWFRFDAPCAGFFRTEVFCLDEEGAGTGDPDGSCDDGGALRLRLWRDDNGTLTQVAVSDGNEGIELTHARLVPGSWLVAVSHEAGTLVDYALETTWLPTGTCAAASWTCEATTVLAATETSCRAEPSSSACAVGQTVTQSVPLPTTDDGQSGTFLGWAVHTAADEVATLGAPTSKELGLVAELCEAACQAEYAHEPDIAANCTASGAFEDPEIRTIPSEPAVVGIAAGDEHGAGIFGMQALLCDLRDDCCAEFDERSACAAIPARVTPGPEPLGRAEERRVTLGGSSTNVVFVTPGGQQTMPLTGSAGYTLCPAGETGTTCPFYLGSLALAGSSITTITDTCPDSSAFSAEVKDVEVELLQPAMGIASSSGYDKGFPPGALHLEARLTVDSEPMVLRGSNQQTVLLTANTSELSAANLAVDLVLPCGNATIPVQLSFAIQSTSFDDQPPSVSIDVPATVTCPSTVSLAATASDPDSDLDTVRWYIDDVLMGPSTTSVIFTTGHELRAVATDARGAATTATKSVACE